VDEISNLEILDCTIRDGGYVNSWRFTNKFVKQVYHAVTNSGVDFFEIGFIDPINPNYGPWNHLSPSNIHMITSDYVGCKIGAMVNYGKTSLNQIMDKDQTGISIIRVAVHKNKIKEAIHFTEKIGDLGYKTSLQMMGYSTLSSDEQKNIRKLLNDANINYAYIADSYGALEPKNIKHLLLPLMNLDNLKIGFHAHNNIQTAFANTLEAINCGVDIVDGSILGMGRGAGNMPLELLIALLERENPNRYNVKPLIHCIDRQMLKIYGEPTWGYNHKYALTGIYNLHPYFIKKLLEEKNLSITQSADKIKKLKEKQPIGFSQAVLDEMIEKDVKLTLTPSTISKTTEENILNKIKLPSYLKKLVNIFELVRRYRIYSRYTPFQEKLRDYHDKHIGQRCFIIATGPSINKTNLDLLEHEIVFGVNTLYKALKVSDSPAPKKFNVNPMYYVLGDHDVFQAHHKNLLVLDTDLFLSSGAGRYFIENSAYYLFDATARILPIRRLGRMNLPSDFSKNLIKGTYSSGSVTIHALQVAFYLGFQEVYLVGCDCDYTGEHHFDGKKTVRNETPVLATDIGKQRVFQGYEFCKKAFEDAGRTIYNSTVGGKLEVFERKSLEEVVL